MALFDRYTVVASESSSSFAEKINTGLFMELFFFIMALSLVIVLFEFIYTLSFQKEGIKIIRKWFYRALSLALIVMVPYGCYQNILNPVWSASVIAMVLFYLGVNLSSRKQSSL